MKQPMRNNLEPIYGDSDPDGIQKIKRIAYHLWLNRRDNDLSGSAEQDYFEAEQIYHSHQARKHQSLGNLCVWTVTFLAAESPEPHYLNAAKAAVAFESLAQEYELI